MTIPERETWPTLIQMTMTKEPRLTAFGIGVYFGTPREQRKAKFAKDRADMLHEKCIEQFGRACMWLHDKPKTKQITPRAGTSYGLKHCVERWHQKHFEGEAYVSNGMFIAAAIALGFQIRNSGGEERSSPNVFLNITSARRHLDPNYPHW